MYRSGGAAWRFSFGATGCHDTPVKLEIASRIPLERKRNARKTRGLNVPDSDDEFLFMAMAAR
jgi:hypothetical protein